MNFRLNSSLIALSRNFNRTLQSNRRRYWLAASLCAMLWVAAGFAQVGTLKAAGESVGAVRSDEAERATVVVQLGDQDVLIRKIDLSEPINGFQALDLAGLTYGSINTEFGPALCSIEGVGCPTTNCFCADGAWTNVYWENGAWEAHSTGAGSTEIAVGDVDGWRWAASFGEVPKDVTQLDAASHGLAWLATQQSEMDGGYGARASGGVEMTLALGANNMTAEEWQRSADAPSLAQFLQGTTPSYAQSSAAAAGKLGVALAVDNLCRPLGAVTPSAFLDKDTGYYAVEAGFEAWAILGALAMAESVPDAAIDHLRGLAQPNGGWEWWPGWGTDTNSTAVAIQALIAAGEAPASTVIVNGLAYLEAAQNEDGGFPYDPDSTSDTGSDTNSTAYAVQALIAAGEDVADGRWTRGGNTSIDFLLSQQLADGSFEWKAGTGSNLLATQQAAVALLGESYPIATREVAACEGVYIPYVQVVGN